MKCRFFFLLCLLTAILGCEIAAFSQEEPPVIDGQAKRNSPLTLGEPVELSLIVTKRQPVTISAMPTELQAAPQLPPAPSPQPTPSAAVTPTPPAVLTFALDQSQPITPQQTDQGAVETYRYLLAAPPQQAGEYVIPAFSITYRAENGAETEQRQPEITLYILNPNTDNLDVPTNFRFLLMPALIASLVALTAILLLLYLKRRQPRAREENFIAPAIPPGELARRELADIQAMRLPQKGEFKAYYTLLSETVRKFVGAEYEFHVLERTTEEILGEVRRRDMPESVKQRINALLPEADLAKFAKYAPSVANADAAMQDAARIVDDSLEFHRPKLSEHSAAPA